MPALLYAAHECACCERGGTEVESSLLVRSRSAVKFANASQVPENGQVIADHHGYSLSGFGGIGWYRTITITEAYAIITPGEGRTGTWNRVTELTHTGENFVDTPAARTFDTEITDDDDPISPAYVDFLGGVDLDESDVEVGGEITEGLVKNAVTSALAGLDWEPLGDTALPELGDWMQGIAVDNGGGYGVGREAQWAATVVFRDLDYGSQSIETHIADGDVALPATVKKYRWTTASETQNFLGQENDSVPWRSTNMLFAHVDPGDTSGGGTGWNGFPDLDTTYWHRVEIVGTFGDLWPLFRIV